MFILTSPSVTCSTQGGRGGFEEPGFIQRDAAAYLPNSPGHRCLGSFCLASLPGHRAIAVPKATRKQHGKV